jgi:hypothetical protein
MVGRETVGVGVPGKIGEANGFRGADDQSEYAVTSGQIPYESALLGIDAVSDKALQEAAVRCQHPDGGVPGSDDLRCYLDDPLEYSFQGDFGNQRRSGYNQPLHPRTACSRTDHGCRGHP